jgi:copper resistance protein B
VLALAAAPGTADAQMIGGHRYLYLSADRLEHAPGLDGRPMLLEADAWYGGSYNRLWIKVEGGAELEGGDGELEAQALYSRLIAPYWDAQIGVGVDAAWDPLRRARGHLAVGIQGLAPYWFEVEAMLYVSHEGDVSASLEAAYDLLVTQRLVLESEAEVQGAFHDQLRWGIAQGVSVADWGVRARYEVVRELAPYVGWAWSRSFGRTARLRREAGKPAQEGSLVAGVRVWY